MNEIQQKIESFLKDYKLNKVEYTYLVAFSGGYDSMCLLDSLKRNRPKNKIVAIHINHNWRGEESDCEENNCRIFCKKIGVEFYCEKLDNKIPHTETAAREARYKFFENCAKKFNTEIVFTAHNKNDNAETLIYRICNGTGITGLQGISENRDIYYRPLLSVSREDIEKYCQDNALKPNSDSSNFDTKYKRNFIRAKVLPTIKEVNSNILENLTTLSAVAKEETEIVNLYLDFVLSKISLNGKIDTNAYLQQSESVQKRIIYNIFIQHNLDYDRKKILQVFDFIKKNSTSKSGKTYSLTTDLWVFVSEKFIEITQMTTQNLPILHITKEGYYTYGDFIMELTKFNEKIEKFPQDSKNIAYINLEQIPLDFELRQRKEGDVIQPLGLCGTQKLKKYLNEKKIPKHEKDNLLFLANGTEIFWAIGLGISDKIKVNSKPTHILKFYKKEGK